MAERDLRTIMAELRRRFEAGELAQIEVELDGYPPQSAQWLAQMLFDEAAEYQALPAVERNQEPWLGMRRSLAAQFVELDEALRLKQGIASGARAS